MDKIAILELILDSWNKRVVFADCGHIIRYMNKAAQKRYSRWGNGIGKSLLDCHNEESRKMLIDCFEKLQNGAEEVLYKSNGEERAYMRAVRNELGTLEGYIARYEPPIGK